MSVWTEHRNPEGRTYWFNTGTRESVWEKPDELKTPFERALNETKWKEYFSGGRKYYYNTETKESKWDMPDELLLLLEKVEKEGKPSPAAATNGPARIAAAPGSTPAGDSETTPASATQTNGTETAVGPHTGGLPFASGSILPARPNLPDDPVIPHNGFATVEEGEKAFTHLLRKAGVDANWTWDQTMRAIITDPLYKALNTLAEKKACWQKYTDGLKAKEQEEREARLSKLRPAIRNMLKGNPNVFHYTTFPTADRLFAQHPIWQQAKIEAERKLIFEEYVAELKQREVQEARAARSRGISKVVTLFKQLNVDVVTRWRQAHSMLLESEDWSQDPELQKLPTLDILLAFEDYSRVREREYEEQTRRAQVEKARKERKAREAFRDLLQGLVAAGHIKARSKWKEVYPLFSKDERYLNMLGNPGSNPLELFWDAVDALDQKLDAKIAIAEQAIARHIAKQAEAPAAHENDAKGKDDIKDKAQVFVTPETTEEEFNKIIQAEADEAVASLSEEDLHLVFVTLHQQAVKKQADEKRRAERRQRHLQDDLRYALKKLPEPIDINMSYEEVVPLIENLPEYKAIEDDEGRRAAFAKFVKRQKERLREASEDGASTTSRKRKEPPRDREVEREREWDRDKERERDRDRERDRGKEHERDGRSSRHHRGYDDLDGHGHRSSRDYVRSERDRGERDRERDRDERDRDREKERERDREGYRSKHGHYRDEKDDRKRRSSRTREWEESPRSKPAARERSTSYFKDDPKERREGYDEKMDDDRAEKRARYDDKNDPNAMEVDQKPAKAVERAETPEEGEI